ncbi:hypothetical protein ACIBQX_50365, partial [Nonomuraea sp. NPDC049714]
MTIHAPEIPATESTLNDLPEPLASDTGNATDDATTELNPRQEAVWRALVANPGSSATTIGAAADMSRVAAGKILNQLEADGRARRTPGGQDGQTKGRTPDRWYAIDASTTATDGADLHDATEAALAEVLDPVTPETPADIPESVNETEPDSEVPDEPLEIQGETDDALTSTTPDVSPATDSGEESASESDAEPEDSERAQARRELLELADLILGAAAAMEADGDAVLALGRLEMAMAKAPQAHRNAR